MSLFFVYSLERKIIIIMKKTKILVPAIAVLALGIAASTTATVAWYTATATAAVNNASPVTGTLTTAASTQDMAGSFTITPSAIGDKSDIALTDANGKTYVSVSDGQGGYTAYEASGTNLYATYALSATVTYDGPLQDAAAIQSLWEASCTSVTLTLSCTGASGTAVTGSASTSDIHYITSSSNFADLANGNVITLAANTITVGTEKSFGNVLVAVRGSDSVVWTGADAQHKPSYTMQCAATHA